MDQIITSRVSAENDPKGDYFHLLCREQKILIRPWIGLFVIMMLDHSIYG